MQAKEAKARIKINKLLEESGWRFLDVAKGTANIVLEPKVTHAKQIAWVRCQIWDLYADLKAYKTNPRLQNPTFQEEIRQRFRELCRTRTTYQTLNGHLKRLLGSQDELLRVLEDPNLPLHNNLSESDIREYVKRRKISGSTRSDAGRRCRDTFASLKKTCRKLGISFWQYLCDRVSRSNAIAPLGEAVRQGCSMLSRRGRMARYLWTIPEGEGPHEAARLSHDHR